MAGSHPLVPGLTDLTVVAHGGYATIYRAHQESVGRDVAVKIENRPLESDRDRRRFLREARASGRMSSHPHVVDLFDAGVCAEGNPYLIMELCDGSYADRIKVAPISPWVARDVGVKIANALASAHAWGILHRDVKPANILVTRFGQPALADFGLAVLAENRDISITLDVMTPAYAPPEAFDQREPTPSGDIYSLCAALYAMMRGRPPRWNAGETPSISSLADLFDEPLCDIAGVSAYFMDILRRGMSNDPRERPTAEQLCVQLSALPLSPPPPTVAASDIAEPGSPEQAEDESTVRFQPPVVLVKQALQDRPLQDGHLQDGPPQDGPRPSGLSSAKGFSLADLGGTTGPRETRGKFRLLALMLAAVSLTLAVIFVTIVVTTGGDSPSKPARALSPSHVNTSVAISSQPSLAAQNSSPFAVNATSCPWGVQSAVRCPAIAECYDSVSGDANVAKAVKVDCATNHTWEVFAMGELPRGLAGADHSTVATDPQVRQVCAVTTLALVAGFGTVGWQIEVLPPRPEAVSSGDLTYRCLAGKGNKALVGSTIIR